MAGCVFVYGIDGESQKFRNRYETDNVLGLVCESFVFRRIDFPVRETQRSVSNLNFAVMTGVVVQVNYCN